MCISYTVEKAHIVLSDWLEVEIPSQSPITKNAFYCFKCACAILWFWIERQTQKRASLIVILWGLALPIGSTKSDAQGHERAERVLPMIFEGANFRVTQSTDAVGRSRWLCQIKCETRILVVGKLLVYGVFGCSFRCLLINLLQYTH